MRRLAALAFAALVVTLTGCSRSPGGAAGRVFAAYDRLAVSSLWPGFRPGEIPLALYDGEKTYLLRHPRPPEGFRPVRGFPQLQVMDGRYPTIRANSRVDVEGVGTAALLADEGERSPEESAGLLIHEAFHVFETQAHPTWAANEVDLFTYPVENPEFLRWRRLETGALRRALQPADSTRELCWARTVVWLRGERLRELPGDAAAYERQTELWEGLARYVEARAARRADPPALPAEGYRPDQVRERAYATGHAFAYLLDRLQPTWKEKLATDSVPSLAARLGKALAATDGPRCHITPDESSRARAVARSDVAELVRERIRREEGFETRPGWSIVVDAAPGQPLNAAEFDPLNLQLLGRGDVLHTRLLRLRNATADIQLLNIEALTRAAGPHPLFSGVRRLMLTGLKAEPKKDSRADTLRVETSGFTGEFHGATLRKEGHRWMIGLSAPTDSAPEPDP